MYVVSHNCFVVACDNQLHIVARRLVANDIISSSAKSRPIVVGLRIT